MSNIPWRRAVVRWGTLAALNRGILAIYYKTLRCLIANVKFLIYGLIYHGCQPISIQGSNNPVYN